MKKIAMYGAFVASTFGAMSVNAASILPAGTLTAVTTDAVDTVIDLATQGLPLVTGIALGWFIVTGVKSLLARGGIR